LFSGFLEVSLESAGHWHRRYLALYADALLIFPRSSSAAATARDKCYHFY
jgi:hypothetical protein